MSSPTPELAPAATPSASGTPGAPGGRPVAPRIAVARGGGSTPAAARVPVFRVGEEVAALLEALLAEPTPARAAAAFCSRLAVAVGARRVCLGVLVPGRPDARGGAAPARRCRLIAESFRPRPELPPEQVQQLSAAIFEACDQQVVVDSEAQALDGPVAQCAQVLAAAARGRVLTVPLGEAGQVYGALVIEIHPAAPSAEGAAPVPVPGAEQLEELFIRIGPLTARLLSLIEVKGPWARGWARLTGSGPAGQGVTPAAAPTGSVAGGAMSGTSTQGAGAAYLGGLVGRVGSRAAARFGDPRQVLRRRLLGVGAAVVAGIVVWPWPHSISAPARLEGELQRVVAAPADGYLKEVVARPGDRVRAGQLLGALGERELDLDRGRLGSDLAQRRGEKAVALAKGDRAAMMIAQSRMDEAQAQLDLIEQQSQRYLLTSPIDGVVIEGDWVRAVGAPLERGKALFTVAPVDRYRVMVDLDERDINDVRVGQTGRVALSALPADAIRLKVVRIGAAAGVVDGRNVFEIEAEPIDPPAAGLRPGLKGVARLEDESRALLTVWWRRLAHASRALWWRWWP